MENYSADQLTQKLSKFPLFTQYLGPSLLKNITQGNWFENRFLRDIFLDSSFVERFEKLFVESKLVEVKNSENIFSGLAGDSLDYNFQVFDSLSEVRLIHWAQEKGYDRVEKLIPVENVPTPDLLMLRDDNIAIAEAKHFRTRDYLLDFVYERIGGIFLISGLFNEFGLTIETTSKYEAKRDVLVKQTANQKKADIDRAREAIPKSILNCLTYEKRTEIELLGGLMVVKKNQYTGAFGVSFTWGLDPEATFDLMSSKIEGDLKDALKQINSYISSQNSHTKPVEALVFISGADPTEMEWNAMWDCMMNLDDKFVWEKINQIYLNAKSSVQVPFSFVVGMGNPLRYDKFTWIQEECTQLKLS